MGYIIAFIIVLCIHKCAFRGRNLILFIVDIIMVIILGGILTYIIQSTILSNLLLLAIMLALICPSAKVFKTKR